MKAITYVIMCILFNILAHSMTNNVFLGFAIGLLSTWIVFFVEEIYYVLLELNEVKKNE